MPLLTFCTSVYSKIGIINPTSHACCMGEMRSRAWKHLEWCLHVVDIDRYWIKSLKIIVLLQYVKQRLSGTAWVLATPFIWWFILRKALSSTQSGRSYFPKMALPINVYPLPHHHLAVALTPLLCRGGGSPWIPMGLATKGKWRKWCSVTSGLVICLIRHLPLTCYQVVRQQWGSQESALTVSGVSARTLWDSSPSHWLAPADTKWSRDKLCPLSPVPVADLWARWMSWF